MISYFRRLLDWLPRIWHSHSNRLWIFSSIIFLAIRGS
jgi:hypothetical protein